MPSLGGRVARLKREMESPADEEKCQRWERQRDAQRAREEAEARRRWFYWNQALILQRWGAHAERSVVSGIARMARRTGVYPNQWRCGHHLVAALQGPHGEEVLRELRWAMALLEMRGELWPPEMAGVDRDDITTDDLAWALGKVGEWLRTISERPGWAYEGMTPDAYRQMYPLDNAYRRRLIAKAEAAFSPTHLNGAPLPPCPDCLEGDA